MKVLEGFEWILQHRNIIQKEKKWLKTSKPPMLVGSFQVPNMRWRVWKLVFLTPTGQIDQKNTIETSDSMQKVFKNSLQSWKKWQLLGKISVQDNVNHMGISFLISLNNPLLKNVPHVGSFWHFIITCICVFVYFVFVFLYLHVWHMGISFLTSLNNPLLKNIPQVGGF